VQIVDSQVHIWAANTPDRPWVSGMGGRAHLPEPLGYDRLLRMMDEAGVDAAVLVPPSLEGDRNDLSLEAAQKYPERFAVMGRIAIDDPDGRAKLQAWKDRPGMLGLRLTFHRPDTRPQLDDGTADWLWPAAEEFDVPIMIHAPERLSKIGDIATRHPGLRIVVDHMGFARETMERQGGGGRRPGRDAGAAPERLCQGFGCAVLHIRTLSVPQSQRTAAPRHRRLRSTPRVLGHRPLAHAGALLVPPGRHAFHRRARFPLGRRSRLDHGPRPA
jgi:hypothetical protein